ncbi:MAG: 4-alpha-glucanotransferase, partial [Clostridia bacterium]|nr:4-alpha-glucanotransferase [Clostridia bacterium]
MINRESGILLNISSLPGKYGIGKFGEEAVCFAHFLKSMGFSRWQVLPFNPIGPGECPYASPSAFAGNILYISPDMLVEDGYITPADAKECIYYGSPHVADYEFAEKTTMALLEKAYAGLTESSKFSFYPLLNEQVQAYCRFMALKDKHEGKPFPEWGDDALPETASPDEDRVNFYAFTQCTFFDQWARTKKQINKAGIKIIGDIPIYVYSDSADVWANNKVFKINEDFSLSNVAGAPPDYFSEDGQLWGNPLYD